MADDRIDDQLRRRITEEWGVWSAGEVARRAGSKGHSPTTAVRRWAAAGKLLAVPVAGDDHYPGFCFDDAGRPRPVIAAIRRAAGDERQGWALAAWMVTPSPALDGARPVDLLDSQPDLVVAALDVGER